MHVLILLCLGGVLASAAASVADDIELLMSYDAEPVLNDPVKWKVVYNCYMDLEPCGELQKIKDATVYSNECEKCTPEQKKKFDDIIQGAVEKHPEDCNDMFNKILPKTE